MTFKYKEHIKAVFIFNFSIFYVLLLKPHNNDIQTL